ncbi:MAG: hypothetical protein Ct9H300mP32_5940 [Verrucomicrobiota bacterium]|nr:MAG: hypothetical protein Ct9H300mP32_5940 [Verrucomicrobiota bacterium]
MFPHIAEMADEMTVIRSMTTDSANHTPGLFFANSGFEFNGFPSVGSWVSYGLGSDTESLPAFVVLSEDAAGPMAGRPTGPAGFSHPASGGRVAERQDTVRDLFPAIEQPKGSDAAARAFLKKTNPATPSTAEPIDVKQPHA